MPQVRPVHQKHKKISIATIAIVGALLGLSAVGVLIFVEKKPAVTTVKPILPDYSDAAHLQAYYDKRIAASAKPVDTAEPYFEKAQVEITGKNYQAALADALKASKLQPDNPMFAASVGDIYVYLNDGASAIPYYEQAVKLYGADPDQAVSAQNYQAKIDSLRKKP